MKFFARICFIVACFIVPRPFALADESASSSAQLDALYHASLRAMRNLRVAPAFSFHYRISQELNAHTNVYEADVTLRASDGIAKWSDHRRENKRYFVLRPDLFVSGVPTDRTGGGSAAPGTLIFDTSAQETTPKGQVIGRITGYPRLYAITEVNDTGTGACAGSRHLVFSPLSDPAKHNLRDLWIDRETQLICKATLLWDIATIDNDPLAINVSLDVNKTGLIETFESSGVAHSRGKDYPYVISGSLKPLQALPTVPDGF